MRILGWIVVLIGMVVVLTALTWAPFHLLWNWLMPSLFHLPRLSWLQSLGLLTLCNLMFKSYNSSGKK